MRDLVLAIETSNPGAAGAGIVWSEDVGPGVALGRVRDGGVAVLGVEPLRVRAGEPGGGPPRGGHDDDLIGAIDRLCARAAGGSAAARGRLARIGVSVGPGGYTGVRVACCAAKMIAEASAAQCVAVPSALVVHESLAGDLRNAGMVAVALASKGESSWVVVFKAGGASLEAGSERRGPIGGSGVVVRGEELAKLLDRGVGTLVSDRHLPDSMRRLAEARGVRVIEPVFSAATCLRLSASLAPVDPAMLTPLYPREPDAVTLWRNKGRGSP